jgi:peptidoglycan/LPS O-acetylase OafA/YrhL
MLTHTHTQISRWITELFLSHLLGYILYLVVEAPFNNLTKQFFGKVSKQEAGKRIDASPTRDVNENIRTTANTTDTTTSASKIKSS